MTKSVAEKMGVKQGSRAFILNAPADLIETLRLPPLDIGDKLAGSFEYLHLFAETQTDLHRSFSMLSAHLAPRGMLWVSWPKRGQLGTDLVLSTVIRIGYEHGMVESKTISVNPVWSAIKFTHPIPGKTYNNSFGTLKERRSATG